MNLKKERPVKAKRAEKLRAMARAIPPPQRQPPPPSSPPPPLPQAVPLPQHPFSCTQEFVDFCHPPPPPLSDKSDLVHGDSVVVASDIVATSPFSSSELRTCQPNDEVYWEGNLHAVPYSIEQAHSDHIRHYSEPTTAYLSQPTTVLPASSAAAAPTAIDNHDADSSLHVLGHSIPPDDYWHYHHHHTDQVTQLTHNYGTQLDFQPGDSSFGKANAQADNLVVETSSYYHHFNQQDHHLQQVPWPSPSAQQECFYQQHQEHNSQQQQQNVEPLPSFPAFCFDQSIDFSNPSDIFQFDKAYEAPYQEGTPTTDKFHFDQQSPRENNDEAYYSPQQQT